MTKAKYKKMDKFVNEMNQSVNIVGDMSIYIFNRFRNFVGYLFIAITTVAISFIVAEFVRSFQFSPIFGMDAYYVALFGSLVIGLYIAFYGEEAKIATIKGAIFSSGSNRTWQSGAALFIILILIIVNAKGVQKIADFSLRYMDQELQDSVVFKLKEQKMKNYTSLATSGSSHSTQDSALLAMLKTRGNYERSKKREILVAQQVLDSLIAGRDAKVYRTYIANKKLEINRKIAKIEDRWDRKFANIDSRISKAQDKLDLQTNRANKMRQSQLTKSDKATEDLISHYKKESNNNISTINRYKDIGLIVAIGGEIIDGFLAFLLFMIVKSNPNVNGTPQVQLNTRQMIKMKSYESDNFEDIKNSTPSLLKESRHQSLDNDTLSDNLFQKIKKVAMVMSKEENNYVEVGMNKYLNHPSQREIIKAFGDYGILISPYQVGEYFKRMEDQIMFVNQKLGFVYTKVIQKKAA
jgi:hypothetical protein